MPLIMLRLEVVMNIHHLHGQDWPVAAGMRDKKSLVILLNEIASDPDIDVMAAAARYGVKIIQKLPFNGGNKHVAMVSVITFLDLNGFEIETDTLEIKRVFEEIDSGSISESEFGEWLKKHSRPSHP